MATLVISAASVPVTLSRGGYDSSGPLYSRQNLKQAKPSIIQSSIQDSGIRKSIFNGVTSSGDVVFPTDSVSIDNVNEIKNEIIVELLNLTGTKQELLKQYPEVSAYIDSASDNFKALVDSYSASPEALQNNSVVKDQNVALLSLVNKSFFKAISNKEYNVNYNEVSKLLNKVSKTLITLQIENQHNIASSCSSQLTSSAHRISGALDELAGDLSFTPSAYDSYPDMPFDSLRNDWRDQVTSSRIQRMNISGAGLNCGYYSLAMNIAQFSESQRREIYTKLHIDETYFNLLESCRIRSLNENSSNSEYQQTLGQILINTYHPRYGSNISYENLVEMANDLEISLMVVKADNQMYENMHLARNIPVDRLDLDFDIVGVTEVDDSEKFLEALRAAGIVGGGAERNLLTITDTADNMVAELENQLSIKRYNGTVTARDMWNRLYESRKDFITSKDPIAVIYNKNGSASGGHYEAPLHLSQLLFNV